MTPRGNKTMTDIIGVSIAIGFFVLCLAWVLWYASFLNARAEKRATARFMQGASWNAVAEALKQQGYREDAVEKILLPAIKKAHKMHTLAEQISREAEALEGEMKKAATP